MELYFENRESWREWLQENHGHAREVWLVFFKKHTGKPSMKYEAAVEEAICFGWIDSLIKRLDDDRYARKFTPRIDTSRWSAANLRRVKQLKESGQMTEVGLAKVPPDVDPLPPISSRPLTLPQFFAEAMTTHPLAQKQFDQLAPSYRRNLIHWVSSAKGEDTRQRRVAEAITLLLEGKKPGMK
jgi:uncharacterized protein YdeI (YjbR/CyaY-like superfamily)